METLQSAPILKPTGFQRWANLAFLHWKIPVDAIRQWIPDRLEIDTWDGSAWIGIVAFQMERVRPWWAPPIPYLSRFPETNLRTYVHSNEHGQGVWFLSLDASRLLPVTLARKGWGLPYRWSKMSIAEQNDQVHYRCSNILSHPRKCDISILVDRTLPLSKAPPGTLEHFLCERYVMYTHGSKGSLLHGRVSHVPYPLLPAKVLHCDQTITHPWNLELEAPDHVLFSPGVDSSIYKLTPCFGAKA